MRCSLKVVKVCEDSVETRYRTACGTILVRPHHDPRLRINSRLIRDHAGNFLCAASSEETRDLIESLEFENGNYVRTV